MSEEQGMNRADKIITAFGTALTTIGLALQGVAIGTATPRAQLVVQIIAISCNGVGAGCLAFSKPVLEVMRSPKDGGTP